MDERPTGSAPRPAVDYTVLPERVALADTVATRPTEPPPDPTMGRDTETEFLLRHAAG